MEKVMDRHMVQVIVSDDTQCSDDFAKMIELVKIVFNAGVCFSNDGTGRVTFIWYGAHWKELSMILKDFDRKEIEVENDDAF